MQVLISKRVHLAIEEFYDIALQYHPALDEITVIKKMQRLYDARSPLDNMRTYIRLLVIKTIG